MASDSMTISEITATTAENTMEQFTPNIDELSINVGFNPASTFGMTELRTNGKPGSKTCQELVADFLSDINELELIRKTKDIYSQRGIILRTHRKVEKRILTTDGNVSYERYALRPASPTDAKKLFELDGVKTVFPMDYALGTVNLPYKMTVPLMIEISYQAIQSDSFKNVEEYFKVKRGIEVGRDIIRKVTDYIGSIVFENDIQRFSQQNGKTAIEEESAIPFSTDENFYIHIGEVDISLLGEPKSTIFRFAHAFSLNSSEKDTLPVRLPNINDCIALIGSQEDFASQVYALALRSGFMMHSKPVLLYSGEPWIKNLFPNAVEILDFSHLEHETSQVAEKIFTGNIKRGNSFKSETLTALKNGDLDKILVKLGTLKVKYPKRKNAIDLYMDYLLKNRKIIDYPSFIKKAYLIDSSTIETNTFRRLGFAKSRWTVATAQHMLSLISKSASNSWNTVPPIVIRILSDPLAYSRLNRSV